METLDNQRGSGRKPQAYRHFLHRHQAVVRIAGKDYYLGVVQSYGGCLGIEGYCQSAAYVGLNLVKR